MICVLYNVLILSFIIFFVSRGVNSSGPKRGDFVFFSWALREDRTDDMSFSLDYYAGWGRMWVGEEG